MNVMDFLNNLSNYCTGIVVVTIFLIVALIALIISYRDDQKSDQFKILTEISDIPSGAQHKYLAISLMDIYENPYFTAINGSKISYKKIFRSKKTFIKVRNLLMTYLVRKHSSVGLIYDNKKDVVYHITVIFVQPRMKNF